VMAKREKKEMKHEEMMKRKEKMRGERKRK
jgi:hypothetical protein